MFEKENQYAGKKSQREENLPDAENSWGERFLMLIPFKLFRNLNERPIIGWFVSENIHTYSSIRMICRLFGAGCRGV